MSDNPSASQSPIQPTVESDADGEAPPVTVRLTESTTAADPAVGALYEVDATIEFPSVAAAFAFEDRLTGSADDQEYLLTPDHRTDATFFLRCQPVD